MENLVLGLEGLRGLENLPNDALLDKLSNVTGFKMTRVGRFKMSFYDNHFVF